MQNVYFLSPNSVTTNSQAILLAMSAKFTNVDITKPSEYEQTRYLQKLKVVTNFQEFLTVTKQDIEKATQKKIVIDFDSYFFGSDITSSTSSLEYKIVDLDNIYKKSDCNIDEIRQYNIEEFDRAIRGFIEHFVDISSQQNYFALL